MKYILIKDDTEYLSLWDQGWYFAKLGTVDGNIVTGEHASVVTDSSRLMNYIRQLQPKYPNSKFEIKKVYGYTAYRIRGENE